ncbi:hypothetical protein TSUD_129500 [Trifolium subterraneum]|uniref:Uncharacterized protein n=1 Tax=Trifolium subterraneum TaxID=3900 RepID=A0A2Z6PAF6_TRISU|nr:hypothetical protein TSUD_129500 [Trifolium subterraneum]
MEGFIKRTRGKRDAANNSLITNLVETGGINVENTDGYFFQYSVALFYEDGRPVEGKGAAQNKLEIKVVLEDVASNTNNGNCSPEGNGSPNEADRNSG